VCIYTKHKYIRRYKRTCVHALYIIQWTFFSGNTDRVPALDQQQLAEERAISHEVVPTPLRVHGNASTPSPPNKTPICQHLALLFVVKLLSDRSFREEISPPKICTLLHDVTLFMCSTGGFQAQNFERNATAFPFLVAFVKLSPVYS